MTVDQDDDATAFDTPNQSVDWWALAVVAYEVCLLVRFQKIQNTDY